jgi:hypothetical protein
MKNPQLRSRFLKQLSKVLVFFFLSNVQASTPYAGFNFYVNNTKCYLKDMSGKLIHTWTSTHSVMSHAYLLRDSSVLFPYTVNGNGMGGGGDGGGGGGSLSDVVMAGGGFQIIRWDGTTAWNFTYYDTNFIPHHDCDFYYSTHNLSELPTIIAIVATTENTDGRISDKIVEIKPTGTKTADIIWQWFAYDHSTSSATDKPELLDLNKGSGRGGFNSEWTHANSVHLNPKLNQLVIGINWFNEFIIIDHSTTIAQAATHTGGRYGKGGDILYRWGNPSNYGDSGTQYLSRPHSACWIQNFMPGTRKLLPGAGHILSTSNSTKKAYEVTLPATNGVYPRTLGSAFEPSTPTWTVSVTGMGSDQGSMQRLPNGNTLICNGMSTGTNEYDSTGTSVWNMAVSANEFYRYDSTYLGSTKLDTDGLTSINDVDAAPIIHDAMFSVSCEPFQGQQKFTIKRNGNAAIKLSIFTASGEQVAQAFMHENVFLWNSKNRPCGMYFVKIASSVGVIVKRFFLSR